MRRSHLLILLVVFSAACGGGGMTSPSAINQPLSTSPPLSGPSRMFVFSAPVSYPVADYTAKSNFVLYDNGAFTLNYPSGSYRGRHTVSNGSVAFQWDAGWTATGVLNGELLTMRYSPIMQMDDFEDAVYALVR